MSEKTEATDVAERARAPIRMVRVVEPARAPARPPIAEEQLAYAQVLDLGMKLGLLLLVVTFVLYVTGLLAPHLPLADLPRYWTLPVRKYLAATGVHGGWAWLHMVGKGDFLNFVGIAFLAGVSIVCYVAIIPILFRKKDTVYGLLAIAEVAVLVLAASGLLKVGGH